MENRSNQDILSLPEDRGSMLVLGISMLKGRRRAVGVERTLLQVVPYRAFDSHPVLLALLHR